MSVRVRFAPSPTGYLHVGGLRTALFNYLYAKSKGGKIILRIEDTDKSRQVSGSQNQLMNVFNLLGIDFDESPKKNGSFGPYLQSERLGLYKKHVDELLLKNLAYPCFCTSDRLKNIRKEKQLLKKSTQYDRHCLSLSSEQIKEKYKAESFVIRLKIPKSKSITIKDLVRGNVTFNTGELDDQVLLKSDGYPTYHLANVVDDYYMKITHVIRGEEWLSSTPKHILLYNAFNWDLPQFAHVPLLLNKDKSKLSKRQGDVAVEDYLKKGFLPEALINFIVFLGWNPGDNREIFSINGLISEFSLSRIQSGGAVFDKEKLSWMNAQYIKKLSTKKLIEYSSPFIKLDIDKHDPKFYNAMDLAKNRVADLTELENEIKYFYIYRINNQLDKSLLYEDSSQLLFKFWLSKFMKKNSWTIEEINSLISVTDKELGIKGKNLFFPIRLAIYGDCKGPDIPSIYNVLGADEIINRLKAVIKG